MKKISNNRQLQEEKERLKLRQQHLEDKIRLNWLELKDSLRPSNLAMEAVEKVMHRKTDDADKFSGVVKSTVSYGIAMLAKKLIEKATGRKSKEQSDTEIGSDW